MVKADYASDLPGVAFVLPERDEFSFSHLVVASGVMEAVRSDLYCAIVSEGIDLQRSGYELSGDFAADVVLDAVDE